MIGELYRGDFRLLEIQNIALYVRAALQFCIALLAQGCLEWDTALEHFKKAAISLDF